MRKMLRKEKNIMAFSDESMVMPVAPTGFGGGYGVGGDSAGVLLERRSVYVGADCERHARCDT